MHSRPERVIGHIGTETPVSYTHLADNLIKEEIVQLIGADQILGFLVDFPVFIRRQQLGADRGIQYIQQLSLIHISKGV